MYYLDLGAHVAAALSIPAASTLAPVLANNTVTTVIIHLEETILNLFKCPNSKNTSPTFTKRVTQQLLT